MGSLNTLMRDTPYRDLMAGKDNKIMAIHHQLDDYSENGVYTSVKEMRAVVMFSNKQWDQLINTQLIHTEETDPKKANYIQILPDDFFDNKEDTVALSS
jgi:hypothetical protein